MSSLITSNISDGTTSVPTGYVVNGSAKAWVNFNGTGVATIVTSQNISSLTDNGTGYYTVSFTNSFSAEQATVASKWNAVSNLSDSVNVESAFTTLQKVVSVENGSATDPNRMRMITVGDLA